MDKIAVFLDTSALFSAVYSETDGARLILKLGEAGVIQLWVGPWVLREIESVIVREVPKSRPYLALLLDRSNIRVDEEAGAEALEEALAATDYLADAQVIAEALEVRVDYLVSFDREHLIANPKTEQLPFLLGTAGDFLAWYREQLYSRDGEFPL